MANLVFLSTGTLEEGGTLAAAGIRDVRTSIEAKVLQCAIKDNFGNAAGTVGAVVGAVSYTHLRAHET